MQSFTIKYYAVAMIWKCVLVAASQAGGRSDTDFNYQGQLKLQGKPLNSTADFEFTLWDAEIGGTQIGSPVPMNAVQVEMGLFQVKLDFGANALSGLRWLAISVRSPAGAGAFVPVLPRQQLTSSPYSIHTRGVFVDQNNNIGIGTNSPQDELHVRGDQATLRLQDDDDSASYSALSDGGPSQLVLNKVTESGGSLIDFNPVPSDQAGFSWVRFFRETNTTGQKQVHFYRGDNTTQISASIGVDGSDSFFQAHGGNVGIGTTSPTSRLHVETNTDSTSIYAEASSGTGGIGVEGHGRFGIYGESKSSVGYGGVFTGAGPFGSGQALWVTGDAHMGGSAGVGTTTPEAKLHVVSSTVSASDNTATFQAPNIGGHTSHIHFGTQGDWYIRSADAGGKVVIQDNGGDVVIGGKTRMGYEIVKAFSSTSKATATCPSGKRVIGGGCTTGLDSIQDSAPLDDGTGWNCDCDGIELTAYAICARID